ncbi:MAG: hypothetical protein LBT03_00365 [Holosporales bacterium]|jgi:hypothetical protein|nr:hypothetical protein [Holosporales bacterium]
MVILLMVIAFIGFFCAELRAQEEVCVGTNTTMIIPPGRIFEIGNGKVLLRSGAVVDNYGEIILNPEDGAGTIEAEAPGNATVRNIMSMFYPQHGNNAISYQDISDADYYIYRVSRAHIDELLESRATANGVIVLDVDESIDELMAGSSIMLLAINICDSGETAAIELVSNDETRAELYGGIANDLNGGFGTPMSLNVHGKYGFHGNLMHFNNGIAYLDGADVVCYGTKSIPQCTANVNNGSKLYVEADESNPSDKVVLTGNIIISEDSSIRTSRRVIIRGKVRFDDVRID